MKPSVRLAALGVALAGAGVLFAAPAGAATARHGSGGAPQHAVFVQTDNPKGNAIVVYRSRPNGTLVKAGTYRTGGRGGVLDGSVVDHLASQGSLSVFWSSPLVATIMALGLVALFWPIIQNAFTKARASMRGLRPAQ